VSNSQFFFKYRSYTPIPLIIAALILAKTTLFSFIAGFLIALCGELIRIWSVRYAGKATRTTTEVGADELVTTGPYGHVRNPLYVGNFLLSLGMLVIAWPWMPWFILIYLALFYIQYGTIIKQEETFLQSKFGAQFTEYMQNVPRFVPRFSNWGHGVRKPTELKRALRTERNTLQSFTAVTLLLLLRWLLF